MLKQYLVKITKKTVYTTAVYAKSKQDAIDMALMDCDLGYCVEVNNRYKFKLEKLKDC